MKVIIITGTNKQERRLSYEVAVAKELYDKDYVIRFKPGTPINPNEVYVTKYKSCMTYEDIKTLANIKVDSCFIIETKVCDSVTVMSKILDTTRDITHVSNENLDLDYLNSIVNTMDETPCVEYLLQTEELASVLYRFDDTTKTYKHMATSCGVFKEDIWFDALDQANHMNPKPYEPLAPCPHGKCETCEHNRYIPEYKQYACHLEEDTKQNRKGDRNE